MTTKKKSQQNQLDKEKIKAGSSSLEITVVQKGTMAVPKTMVVNLIGEKRDGSNI